MIILCAIRSRGGSHVLLHIFLQNSAAIYFANRWHLRRLLFYAFEIELKHIFRHVVVIEVSNKKMATQYNKFQLLNPLQSLYVFYAFATTMLQQFVTPSFTC